MGMGVVWGYEGTLWNTDKKIKICGLQQVGIYIDPNPSTSKVIKQKRKKLTKRKSYLVLKYFKRMCIRTNTRFELVMRYSIQICYRDTLFPGFLCYLKSTLGSFYFICFNESHLKMMKNAFFFTLKALFVLNIFIFLTWLFRNVEKGCD